MKVWNCFIYSILFAILTLGVWLIASDVIGKMVCVGIMGMWVYSIIAIVVSNENNETTNSKTETYFTDDDFLNCKVGEWISRR